MDFYSDQLVALACVPSDPRIQAAAGVRYEPPTNYILDVCRHCAERVWVGPTQLAFNICLPERFIVLCMACAARFRPDAQPVIINPGQDPLPVITDVRAET